MIDSINLRFDPRYLIIVLTASFGYAGIASRLRLMHDERAVTATARVNIEGSQ